MNILYLAHRIPYPPDKGDKLRAFRHIEHLSKHHRVWCACFIDTPTDRPHVELLARYCQNLIAIPIRRLPSAIRGFAGLLRGGTVTESFYRYRPMIDALRRWSDAIPFDVAVAFSSSMAQYALAIPAKRRVLDLCDCDSEKWLEYAAASHVPARWVYRTEGRRLAARERAFVEGFDATLLITKAEAAMLGTATRSSKTYVVTNGVGLSDEAPRGLKPAAQVVGFVGVMNYRPNVDAVCWFVDQCWPTIHHAFSDAVFRIVGRSPVRRVRRLERVPGVDVVGGVDEILTEVRRFQVSVAPMRIARGLQNKVLEAMAAAKPVVLTSKAAEGIGARNAEDYFIADTARETISAVKRLLGGWVEGERVGQNARRFAAAHHRWDEILRKFELIVTCGIEREEPRTQMAVSSVTSPFSSAVASP